MAVRGQATHVYRSIGTGTALIALLLAVCYAAELAQDVLEQAQAPTPRDSAPSSLAEHPAASGPAPPPKPAGTAQTPAALAAAAALRADEERAQGGGDSDEARPR